MRGPVLVIAAAAAAVLGTGAAGAPATPRPTPETAEVAYRGAVRTATATPATVRRLTRADFWGGSYTASTGERVTIYVSDAYPVDETVPQRWADFVAQLVHGPEIARVKIFLQPSAEIRRTCGLAALACYSPSDATLVAPADDAADGPTAEAVVAHEYGHHIAANRANNPWAAVDFGTKRWATVEQVCSLTRLGRLAPGDEDEGYARNPGEGFAEAYRVLNERRLGRAETPWEIVDGLLYPDDAALAALEQDVVSPWQGASILRSSSTARARTLTVATPLDGTLRAAVAGKGKTTLEILNAGGERLARGTGTVSTTVCGARTVKVRVTRAAGAGRYTLTITRP